MTRNSPNAAARCSTFILSFVIDDDVEEDGPDVEQEDSSISSDWFFHLFPTNWRQMETICSSAECISTSPLPRYVLCAENKQINISALTCTEKFSLAVIILTKLTNSCSIPLPWTKSWALSNSSLLTIKFNKEWFQFRLPNSTALNGRRRDWAVGNCRYSKMDGLVTATPWCNTCSCTRPAAWAVSMQKKKNAFYYQMRTDGNNKKN